MISTVITYLYIIFLLMDVQGNEIEMRIKRVKFTKMDAILYKIEYSTCTGFFLRELLKYISGK